MHAEVRNWMGHVRDLHPHYFKGTRVLDAGSRDVNGTNRWLFDDTAKYVGIDIFPGPGVDVVGRIHEWADTTKWGTFDVVLSTEMLEHDIFWDLSLIAMLALLKPDGLMIVTCAGEGRGEHGTKKDNPIASPYTTDYYCNVTPLMMRDVFIPEKMFRAWGYDISGNSFSTGLDTHMWGIKTKG